jgi:hypothetical protein
MSLAFNLTLQKIDFLNILIVLEGHKCLKVISLESQKLLVLLIVDDKHSVFLLLHLLLEEDIEVCGMHQSNSKISWKNNIHDVDLLNVNTVWSKLDTKLVLHCCGKLGLNVSYS